MHFRTSIVDWFIPAGPTGMDPSQTSFFQVGIPTEAGLPHAFGNAFRNVASLVADIDFTFKEVEDVKKFLEDPDAYAAANPVAAAPAAGGGGEAKKEEKKAGMMRRRILLLIARHRIRQYMNMNEGWVSAIQPAVGT
eukprot:Skav233859  [mRNA]  locus=scaffold6119:260:4747:+ [translate_table: standard]